MILPPKNNFSKNQNKAEFKNLDDSEVLSIDFPGLKTSAVSMTSTASATIHGLNDLYSLISSKKLLIVMIGSSLAPK